MLLLALTKQSCSFISHLQATFFLQKYYYSILRSVLTAKSFYLTDLLLNQAKISHKEDCENEVQTVRYGIEVKALIC